MVGDRILEKFTQIIKRNIRSKDELFRFGGDEFIIIFPNIIGAQVYDILERIKKEIQLNPIYYNKTNKPIYVSFSSGINTMKDGNQTIDEFLDITDKYLYKSKQCGRNKNTYQNL
jgi:diguanylate cyclase (GGDEF)-like protein